MDVATMMRRMEDVGAPVEREHDFDRLFREDGPGLWRTMVAFSGGSCDVTRSSEYSSTTFPGATTGRAPAARTASTTRVTWSA